VRLFNRAGRLLERLGRRPPCFVDSEAALLEAACKATGLHDFGNPGFLRGLRVLLQAYDEEAHLNPFGRMMVHQELGGLLESRLSVQHAWNRSPEVLGAPIRRPIFILGLPRTGTTALHHLLAQDPENQVLEYWLAAAPGPRPPVSQWKSDPRYKQAVRGLKVMYYLDPTLKAIHLMTADGPDECRHLLQQSFTDDTFDSNASIPGYTRWYAQQDMRASYARHRDVLKLIQSPQPERRWVLKYPAHMAHLHVLLETYPDACIVQTHRDPTRVLPSLCCLVTGWRGIYEDGVDVRTVARWQVEMWSQRMQHAMKVRAAADPGRFLDLHFAELLIDPVEAVRRLYEHFEFRLTEVTEKRMRAWHARNPQGKHGGHRYSAAQFGLMEEEIAERFVPYTEHFGVPKEAAQ
jgi:hypothetical protein